MTRTTGAVAAGATAQGLARFRRRGVNDGAPPPQRLWTAGQPTPRTRLFCSALPPAPRDGGARGPAFATAGHTREEGRPRTPKRNAPATIALGVCAEERALRAGARSAQRPRSTQKKRPAHKRRGPQRRGARSPGGGRAGMYISEAPTRLDPGRTCLVAHHTLVAHHEYRPP